MRTILVRSISAFAFMAVGYFVGTAGLLDLGFVKAQDPTDEDPSEAAIEKITAVYSAMKSAAEILADRYKPATKGLNTFAITVGGVDAYSDLQNNRGVDPETFAALYAGQAVDEIADKLDTDEQGRLTYDNRVIRMYPVARLKKLYQERLKYSGEEEPEF